MGGRSFRLGTVANKTASGKTRYFRCLLSCFTGSRSNGGHIDIPAQLKAHRPESVLQIVPSEHTVFEGEACSMCCIRPPYSFALVMPVSCA